VPKKTKGNTLTSGGKREGAGRPKGSDKQMVSVRLKKRIAAWIRNRARRTRYSQARIIEDAVVVFYGLKDKDK
jgi:hypothetical protein